LAPTRLPMSDEILEAVRVHIAEMDHAMSVPDHGNLRAQR
jgi:hypothetical protein